MAPRKRASDKKNTLDPEKLRQIWRALPIDSWLNFFQTFRANHNFHIKGKELWGRCIYHDDPHASFHIRFDQGYAKCFGACSHFESDPVEVAAKAMGQSYADAFSHLITVYGIPGMSPSLITEVQALARRRKVRQVIQEILNAELVAAAGTGRTDEKYAYAQPLISWLAKRNIDTAMLHAMPLGVVPTTDRLWELLNDYESRTKMRYHTEVQSFLSEIIPSSPTQNGPYAGWAVFANHTSPGQVGSFRIRKPGSESGDKSILYVTDKHDDSGMGFFGLGAGIYNTVIGNTEVPLSKTVVVVEGEFTALAAIQPQLHGNLRQIVVAAGGNNNHCLDDFKSMGFEEVRILGDRDAGGVNFNQGHLAETHLKSRVFTWPSHIATGKDLHDVYMLLGGDSVMDVVTSDANYVFPQDWALARLKDEQANIVDNDKGGLAKLAMRISHCLTDSTEKEVYILAAAKMLDLPEAQLKKHIATADTEEGFVSSLVQLFERTYNFMYTEPSPTSVTVSAWNRGLRRVTTFDLSKKNTVTAAVRADVGALGDWIESNIGIPEHLKGKADKQGNVKTFPLTYREREYEEYIIRQAVPALCKGLPSKNSMKLLGPGLHYENGTFYLVNGEMFCRATANTDGSLTWTDIDGCKDGGLYTESEISRRWTDFINCADDINKSKPVDLVATYNKLRKFFEKGWMFTSPYEIPYLSAYVLSVGFTAFYSEQPWLFVNSEFQSGKTFLVLNALSDPSGTSKINILEHSIGTSGSSESGSRRLLNSSSLTLICDEFEVGYENDRYPKKQQKWSRELLDSIRGAQNGGSSITHGTGNNGTVTYHLRFPVVLAGIHPLIERADSSRFNTVRMATIPKGSLPHGNPAAAILSELSAEEITEIRRGVTMFALQSAEHARRGYEELTLELANSKLFDPQADQRFKGSLIPILNVIKMVGGDYKTFAQQYSREKMRLFAQTVASNDYDDMWQTVIHTPGLKVPGEEYRDKTFTVAELLADANRRHLINQTNTGVYWSAQDRCLVFAWHTMLGSILQRTKYGARSVTALKSVAATDPRSLTIDAAHKSKVFNIIKQYGHRIENVSVIPVRVFLGDDVDTPAVNNEFVAKSASPLELPASKSYNI